MNKYGSGGQINISGINAQMWAAMSLFLQYLRDPKFASIQLEAPHFQDFNLVFDNGKKIICECKNWKNKLNYSHLRSILNNIQNKSMVGNDDEVLIICSLVDKNLISEVENVRFFTPLKNKFKKKGYSDEVINLLQKVKFWVVPSKFNQEIIYSLFSDLVNFWMPAEEIKKIVNNILIEKIYNGSAKGDSLSKAEILQEISELTLEAKNNSVYYKDDLKKREKQFLILNRALNNPKHPTWRTDKELSAFSANYERIKFATDRLINKKNSLNLEKWDPIWQLNRIYYFTFSIFDVFENNLHTKQNVEYVLSYIKLYIKEIRGFYRSDFFDSDVVKIFIKIIETKNGKNYLDKIYFIIEEMIEKKKGQYFYLKSGNETHEEWVKEEICKLLHRVYSLAKSELKDKIFNLIVSTFNITEDDGDFSHHSPREIYFILSDWLNEGFKGRFEKMVSMISKQYGKFYEGIGSKLKFDGWEHMGGGISFSGSYKISDRHFVLFILAPAIKKFYDQNEEKGWKFIKQRCISETKQVSFKRPDFLNRSVYEIVVDRYVDDDKQISEEAFDILKEFILTKRGIPHKTELVYQNIVNRIMPDEKKWRLVSLTIDKYKIPVNPFAEQIVSNLAKKGDISAKKQLELWFSDPKYYKRFMADTNSAETIGKTLETDLDLAMELFKSLIDSDYCKSKKSDHFGAFDFAVLLHKIVKIDYQKGLSLLRFIEDKTELSRNQQIIYAFSLFKYREDETENEEILCNLYRDVVDPFLDKMGNDVKRICERFTDEVCREAFVQFAVGMAVIKRIPEALRIIKIFINDPDPYLPGENLNDKKDEFNEHKRIENGEEPRTITSVRGWCSWALMKCSILNGRDQIPEIIDLVKLLTEDKNYYVVHMACFALGQLATNRLTILPSNKDILFFNDNKITALELSKKVEKIAFSLLKRLKDWPEKVQNAMAKSILHVFDSIRALNEKDALMLVNSLIELPNEAIEESSPLLIYYSEFRKNNYTKWRFSAPGLYDDLSPDKYDSKKFNVILLNTINKIQKENPDNCFRFVATFEHLMRSSIGNDETINNTKLALKYFDILSDVYSHNIYNLFYRVIKDKINASDQFSEEWYSLLSKCFNIEKKYLYNEVEKGNSSKVYWYPSLYHSEILEIIFSKMGSEKFINLAEVFFNFPKDIRLNESENLVAIVKDQYLTKNDQKAKIILESLLNNNPSAYWYLRDILK